MVGNISEIYEMSIINCNERHSCKKRTGSKRSSCVQHKVVYLSHCRCSHRQVESNILRIVQENRTLTLQQIIEDINQHFMT